LTVRWAERMVFSEEAKGLFNFPFNKGVWMLERAFQIISKKKAGIPKEGFE